MMKLTFTVQQIVTVLVLSRLYTLLTFTTNDSSLITSIAGIFTSIPFQLLLLLPGILILRKSNDQHLLDYTKEQSKLLFYFFAIFLSLSFLFVSLYTMTTFEDFLTTTLYPRHNSQSLTIAMLICVWIAVYYGFNSLLRMSQISSFFIGIVTVIILGFALKDGSSYNLKPVIENPIQDLALLTFYTCIRDIELLPLFYLMFTQKQHFKKALCKYFTTTSVFMTVLLGITLYVLGDYVLYQMYPLYTLTSFINASIFQRLDSFYAVIWVIIAFIRISFYLILGIDALKRIIPNNYHKFLVPVTIFVILISAFIKDNLYSIRINAIYFIILTVLIIISLTIFPLIILITSYVKNRRTKHD